MATKLRGLNVKKVDFVDDGANPDADIVLYKNKSGKPGEVSATKTGGKESIWKRMFAPLAKLAGIEPEELDSAVEAIEKSGATTFAQTMNERKNRKIADEMWDVCFALNDSMQSIMRDEELDAEAASAAMQESLDDFNAVVTDAITKWSSGKVASITKRSDEVTEEELEVMKSARDRLDGVIQKSTKEPYKKEEKPEENNKNPKGEDEEMKIDKSKLTPAERAFLEEIEKRYGAEEQVPAITPTATPVAPETQVEKSAPADKPQETTMEPEDIYKGMHPLVKAELEALKKFREDAEDRELHEVAKRYTIIGKKEEDLFPVLKSMKAAGGTAYTDMLAVLDQTKEMVEKSNLFAEIGKSGGASNAGNGGGAWVEAETKAAEIMKSKSITKAQALDEVFNADPALAKKCEEEE